MRLIISGTQMELTGTVTKQADTVEVIGLTAARVLVISQPYRSRNQCNRMAHWRTCHYTHVDILFKIANFATPKENVNCHLARHQQHRQCSMRPDHHGKRASDAVQLNVAYIGWPSVAIYHFATDYWSQLWHLYLGRIILSLRPASSTLTANR